MNNPAWWQSLVETALLGTERRAFDAPGLPPELLGAGAEATSEQTLLQTTALANNYLRAGHEPLAVALPDLPVCPSETKPRAPAVAEKLLIKILDETEPNRRLLGLWLRRAAERGWVLPPDKLPAMLDLGTKPQYADCHPALRLVLSERGRWLSQFNADWRYLDSPDPETTWRGGNSLERQTAFWQLRQTDPASALALLQADWPAEAPKARLRWLDLMSETVAPADEPFLNGVLTELDAGKKPTETQRKLRAQAVVLLLDLPESALFEKTQAALSQYVTQKRELIFNKVKLLTLPSSPDAFLNQQTMAGLGLDIEPELTDSQQIYSWFHQLLAMLHPSCWTNLLAVGYEQLVGALKRQKWFTHGGIMNFTKAVIRHRIAPVAAELLPSVSAYQQAQLLALLPHRTREDRLTGFEFIKNLEMHPYLTEEGATGWSVAFSQWVVGELARLVRQQYRLHDAQRQFLADLVLVLHPDASLTVAAVGFSDPDAANQEHLENVLQTQLFNPLARLLRLRQAIEQL